MPKSKKAYLWDLRLNSYLMTMLSPTVYQEKRKKPRNLLSLFAAIFLQTKDQMTIINELMSYLNLTRSLVAICPWKFIFSTPTWVFSRKIVEPFRTSMVKDFINRLPKWRRDTRENGTLVCWWTTVGLSYEKHRRTLTKGEKFQSRCRYVFFRLFDCLALWLISILFLPPSTYSNHIFVIILRYNQNHIRVCFKLT